jgi:hypothetical protein
MDSIAAIDVEVYTSTLCHIVLRILDTFQEPIPPSFTWADAELALYLVYIYAEGRASKAGGPVVFEDGAKIPTHIGLMLARVYSSGL